MAFNRALFTPEEVSKLKRRFAKMDFDHDDRITASDLKNALSRLGYSSIDDSTVENIIDEVDFHKAGAVYFDDFLEVAAGLKELSIETAFSSIVFGDGDDDDDTFHAGIPVEKSGGGA